MSYDLSEIKPMGEFVLVKLLPESRKKGDLDIPAVAAKKIVCKDCRGGGCFIRPIYEEDGQRISRHLEVPCERCNGRGYRSKAYKVGGEEKDRWAEVIAVGPGRQRRVTQLATGRITKWLRGRDIPDLSPGDHVLLNRWASMDNPLDDEEFGYRLVRYSECSMRLPEGEPVPPIETLPSW